MGPEAEIGTKTGLDVRTDAEASPEADPGAQTRGTREATGVTEARSAAAPPSSLPFAPVRLVRNPPLPYDDAWVRAVRVNRSAAERRAATLMTRRSVKRTQQAAWLLRAIGLLDLTTLAGDDTPGRVRRLAAKARRPLRPEVQDALGAGDLPLHTAAVCVYHQLLAPAREALAGSPVALCAVSAGFPAGQIPLGLKLEQIRASVEAGAQEIDIVISRALALRGDWRALYDQVRACREACGPAGMKTILAVGELATLRQVAIASRVCLLAGSDVIKTSTGKEKVNATLPAGLVMLRAIRAHAERTGQTAGFKPAGGIGSAKQVLSWMVLVREELGVDWLRPERLRIGASSVLADLERQLEHHATGRYAAAHHQPLG